MKVVIVGAGQVGYQIADRLSREGHDIALIERSAEKVASLATKLNALVVEGIGASAEVLEKVEVQDADLFIAVTDMDEVNLVSCMLANEYGVPTIISRIRNIEYTGAEWAANAKKLGIDLLINQQTVVAKEIRWRSSPTGGSFFLATASGAITRWPGSPSRSWATCAGCTTSSLRPYPGNRKRSCLTVRTRSSEATFSTSCAGRRSCRRSITSLALGSGARKTS